jgi:hypothetical protein
MSLADHLRKLRPAPGQSGPLRDPSARAGRNQAEDAIGTALRGLLSAPERSRLGGDWIHASQLYKFCSRQHVIAVEERAAGRGLLEVFGAPLRWRFDVGNAVHDIVRDRLAEAGIIEGRWECPRCETIFPENESETCRRPWERCDCGTPVRFVEPTFRNHEHRISGNPDGIYVETRVGREPLEIKSIESALFRLKGKLPLPEHVFRVNLYCWLSGMPRGRILYASTGIEHASPFREFTVRFDLRVVQHVIKRVAELRGGGVRACVDADDTRALTCPVRKQCWR